MLENIDTAAYFSDSSNPYLGAGTSLLLVQESLGDAILVRSFGYTCSKLLRLRVVIVLATVCNKPKFKMDLGRAVASIFGGSWLVLKLSVKQRGVLSHAPTSSIKPGFYRSSEPGVGGNTGLRYQHSKVCHRKLGSDYCHVYYLHQ
jgi:hypothetical protein